MNGIEWGTILSIAITSIAGCLGYAWSIQRWADKRIDDLAKDLSDYKLSAAMMYATIAYTKDIEARTATQLSRIESKLDRLMDARHMNR